MKVRIILEDEKSKNLAEYYSIIVPRVGEHISFYFGSYKVEEVTYFFNSIGIDFIHIDCKRT